MSEVVGLLKRARGKDDAGATWTGFDRDRQGVVEQQVIPHGLEDGRNAIGLHWCSRIHDWTTVVAAGLRGGGFEIG